MSDDSNRTDARQPDADRMSVAPADPNDRPPAEAPDQHAAQDESIDRRLQKNPESKEARLDAGLDESMDASDPPASTQPVHSTDPAPSSGYDPEAERQMKDAKDQRDAGQVN